MSVLRRTQYPLPGRGWPKGPGEERRQNRHRHKSVTVCKPKGYCLSCCGARHLPSAIKRLGICRPLPLAQLAFSATGSARIAPLARYRSCGSKAPSIKLPCHCEERSDVAIRSSQNNTPTYRFPCHCEERSDVAIRSSQNDTPGSHVEKFLLHFGKNYVRIPRVSKSGLTLGCRQAVRHQTLTLAFVGSNPAIPASSTSESVILAEN